MFWQASSVMVPSSVVTVNDIDSQLDKSVVANVLFKIVINLWLQHLVTDNHNNNKKCPLASPNCILFET